MAKSPEEIEAARETLWEQGLEQFAAGFVKLFVRIGGSDKIATWHDEISAESFWAVPTADGYYELRNSPFYLNGLAWGDIVEGTPHADEPRYVDFLRVRQRGGHSTIRTYLKGDGASPAIQSLFDRLNVLGVTYEYAGGIELYAWDVPPEGDIEAVLELFDEGEREEHWAYDYGHIEHLVW